MAEGSTTADAQAKETTQSGSQPDASRKFYEVIYETGAHSVVGPVTEEELLRGLSEHQRRAVAGEYGRTPSDESDRPHNAERIKRVLVYDQHPGNYREDFIHPADDVRKYLEEAIADTASPNGEVHIATVISRLWQSASSLKRKAEMRDRHDSQYRMASESELDPSKWGGDA